MKYVRVRYRFVGAFAKLRNGTIGFILTVCRSAMNISAPTERIFMKFYIGVFFENVKRKSEKNYGTLCGDQFTFLIISRSVLLRMRNVTDKSCRGNQNTHFLFGNVFPKIVSFMRSCGKIW
jgi:hypothetical protein